MENDYLNEEKYKKMEKVITLIATLILVVGFCGGGFLIYKGIVKPDTEKLEVLKKELEVKKKELKDKGVQYDSFTKYDDGEKYDLKIITEVLDPSHSYCSFDEYKNNSLTKEYCSVKNKTSDFVSSEYIGIGSFVCFTAAMMSFFTMMIAKRRAIVAFNMQQMMPVAKEGIDEMIPAIGKAAKEVSKGVKNGWNDDNSGE